MRILSCLAAATGIALSLSACATAKDAIRGPTLSPAAAIPVMAQSRAVPATYTPPAAGPNSLWRAGGRAFFNDQRASRVGDILTVQINIDDKATTNNQSTSSRKAGATAGVTSFLGLEHALDRVLPGGFDPSKAINTASDVSSAGAGSVNRAEKINLTIAAVVTSVLPNGNLFIQGNQEVQTNAELRQLTVSGIVRPEDISSTNTINHTQIAEARINYGGRGDISMVQKTPAGQALLQRFAPF